MTAGTKAANQMISTFAASPKPSQTIASGIHASGGIGRISRNAGLAKASNERFQPIANPSGTPIAIAAMKPSSTSSYSFASAYPVSEIWRSASHDSAGDGNRPGPIACVSDVRTYHATNSTTNVATPTHTGRRTARRGIGASVGAVRERFQLRVGVDHLQIFVGDELVRGRRFGKSPVRLHEAADLREPAVDFGRARGRPLHDLQLSCKVISRPRREFLFHRRFADGYAALLVELFHHGDRFGLVRVHPFPCAQIDGQKSRDFLRVLLRVIGARDQCTRH